MIRSALLSAAFLVALPGCGSADSPDGVSASRQTGSTSDQYIAKSEIVDMGPGELIVDLQTDDIDESGGVAAYLLGPPTFRDIDGPTRIVCLSMWVDNYRGPAIEVQATYDANLGPREPVEAVACDDRPFPASIPAGSADSGSFGYEIPDDEGRLFLKGTHNFDWFIRVPS